MGNELVACGTLGAEQSGRWAVEAVAGTLKEPAQPPCEAWTMLDPKRLHVVWKQGVGARSRTHDQTQTAVVRVLVPIHDPIHGGTSPHEVLEDVVWFVVVVPIDQSLLKSFFDSIGSPINGRIRHHELMHNVGTDFVDRFTECAVITLVKIDARGQ